jgi:hypothetical protein
MEWVLKNVNKKLIKRCNLMIFKRMW